MHDLLSNLTNFLPDVLASDAVDSITCVVFAAAHSHADELIVHFQTTSSWWSGLYSNFDTQGNMRCNLPSFGVQLADNAPPGYTIHIYYTYIVWYFYVLLTCLVHVLQTLAFTSSDHDESEEDEEQRSDGDGSSEGSGDQEEDDDDCEAEEEEQEEEEQEGDDPDEEVANRHIGNESLICKHCHQQSYAWMTYAVQ